MDKGQHIRLLISQTSGSSAVYKYIGLATELQLHLSASVEDSSTKDSTDADGVVWEESDITQKNGDIQFGGLIAVGSDAAALALSDIESGVSDNKIYWKICTVEGTNNRTIVKEICHGEGKIVNMTAEGQVNQKATYKGSINIYGPITVGTDTTTTT